MRFTRMDLPFLTKTVPVTLSVQFSRVTNDTMMVKAASPSHVLYSR
jgi:hypothetical protein